MIRAILGSLFFGFCSNALMIPIAMVWISCPNITPNSAPFALWLAMVVGGSFMGIFLLLVALSAFRSQENKFLWMRSLVGWITMNGAAFGPVAVILWLGQ